MRIADLAFARQEHEHIAARIVGRDLVSRGDDLLCGARIAARVGRSPAHLDRKRAAFDLDDRRLFEVRREARGIDRRRSHDQLEIASFREQALQIAEQEIDVEAALVRLVEDDRVVVREPRIGLRLGEQDAVGHELDQRGIRNLIGEAHLEADEIADAGTELARDATRDRARGNPTRLRAADQPGATAPGRETQFRQLRRLARTRLAGEHDDLMLADQPHDLVGLRADRQALVDADFRYARIARCPARARGLDVGAQRSDLARSRFRPRGRKPPPARQQASVVARHHLVERAAQGIEIGHRVGFLRGTAPGARMIARVNCWDSQVCLLFDRT